MSRVSRAGAVIGTDVAKKAGVSRAAVSSVLGGSRGTVRVSEQTRRRILAAAAELGYSPHPAGQALRRRRSGVIGFVVRSGLHEVYDQPVPHQLSLYLLRAAQRHGYRLIEANAEASASGEGGPAHALLQQRVDGVIFDHPDSESEVRHAVERDIPVVQLMRPQDSVQTATVTVDSYMGIRSAVDHLVHMGHRRVAFVGYQGTQPADRARLENFASSLAWHGIDVDEDCVRPTHGWTPEDGYEPTTELLSLRRQPTALFVASDTLALGALRALYEARVRVPDGISVVSYDDVFAGHLYPPLTSVSQPFGEVAERACASIVEQLENPDARGEPTRLSLPTELNVRESTSEPPERSIARDGTG